MRSQRKVIRPPVAERMARVMTDRAAADGACTKDDLQAAGFTVLDIEAYVDESYAKIIAILPIRRPKSIEQRYDEAHRGEDAEGNGEHDGEGDGAHPQRHRDGQSLEEQLRDGQLEVEALPQIALHRTHHPVEVLLGKRLVQT